jgi:hypothetical protein
MTKKDSQKVIVELMKQIDMEKVLMDYFRYGEAFVEIKEFDVEGFLIMSRDW